MQPVASHAGPGAGAADVRSRKRPEASRRERASTTEDAPRDRFPHTRRPLPWVLVAFVAMLFLVPVDSTELLVHLPVDSHVDRFAVVGLLIAWIVFGGDQRALLRTKRSKLGVVAVCVFMALAFASIVFGAERIAILGELKLSEKHFALLLSFLVLFWFTLTALRFEDVRGFATFLIGIGTFVAFWMLIERRTGYNFFFEWSHTVLSPIARVLPPLTQIHPTGGERPVVVGPTRHGLAATTMMVAVMPFALVRVFDGLTRRTRWLNAIAFVLMFAAAMATSRQETALLVPVALILYVSFYRPRQMLRLLPVGLIAAFAFVHVLAPGAIGSIVNVGRDVESNSTVHRSGDFSALSPDVHAHLLIGRGYGSVSEEEPAMFRINDDQYLDIRGKSGPRADRIRGHDPRPRGGRPQGDQIARSRQSVPCPGRLGRLCRVPRGERPVRRAVIPASALHAVHRGRSDHDRVGGSGGQRGSARRRGSPVSPVGNVRRSRRERPPRPERPRPRPGSAGREPRRPRNPRRGVRQGTRGGLRGDAGRGRGSRRPAPGDPVVRATATSSAA